MWWDWQNSIVRRISSEILEMGPSNWLNWIIIKSIYVLSNNNNWKYYQMWIIIKSNIIKWLIEGEEKLSIGQISKGSIEHCIVVKARNIIWIDSE